MCTEGYCLFGFFMIPELTSHGLANSIEFFPHIVNGPELLRFLNDTRERLCYMRRGCLCRASLKEEMSMEINIPRVPIEAS